VLTALGLIGCGEDAKPSYRDAPVQDATRCERPAAPELQGPARTVGDGSAASCTFAALRDALAEGGELSFDCGAEPLTISVEETLRVLDGTSLDGGGTITLDGGGARRILETEAHSNVLLQGLTFSHGHAKTEAGNTGANGANGSGGAVHRGWQAHLYVQDCNFLDNTADGDQGFGGGALATDSSGWTTLVGCTFSGNSAPLGGAIHSLLSDLLIVDSHFEDNSATDGDGGAVFTDGAYTPPHSEHGVEGGTLSLCGSTFVGNSATASAGAGFLYAYGIDQLSINRCEFRDNQVTTAEPGLGGALRLDAQSFVANSLFVGNQTAGQGGVAWFGRGPIRFENVTLANNHAELWGGALSYGEVATELVNCTLSGNDAGESSGALFGADGALTARNCLFVDNAGDGHDSDTCRRELSGEHNLVWPASAQDACGAAPEVLQIEPLLEATPADHGGATATLALAADSPALGVGTDCPATDQRGEPRAPESCDLGAYER